MSASRRENPQAAIDAVAESLYRSWGCLHLLRGLSDGAREAPEALAEHGDILLQIWRYAFESLFVSIGTLLESGNDKITLLGLLKTLKTHAPTSAQSALDKVWKQLHTETAARKMVKLWRNNAVAHRTDDGRNSDFYIQNKMNLADAEEVLVEIDGMLNDASLAAVGSYVCIREGSEDYVVKAKLLMVDLGIAAKLAAHRGE